jgi:hypothetical protein
MKKPKKLRVGFDIGGIVFNDARTDFTGELIKAVLSSLRCSGHEIYLISRVTPSKRTLDRTQDMFCQLRGTGWDWLEDRAYFCLERHQKALLIRGLRLHFFVDDRREVLDTLEGTKGLLGVEQAARVLKDYC